MSILKKIKDKTGTIHDLGDSRVDAFETELSGAEHNVPYSTAVLAKTNAIEASVSAHVGNTANPHKVTKAQIGLANVENKSSTQIRSELTKENVTNALGYTPIDESRIGAANGVASLDASGRIPASQIPGGFDNIEEYDNLAAFPTTGEEGKIYVAKDTNLTYRWTGSQYVEISPSLALGETATTAYRGDRGKVAYDHSQVSGNSTIHHTHANKELLDSYTQTETDLANAVAKVHTHGNKGLLDTYKQKEADLANAVAKVHTHGNKGLLDTYKQKEADLANAVAKVHAHGNKGLLDTYKQKEADLANAVAKVHTHGNKSVLDGITSAKVTSWDGKQDAFDVLPTTKGGTGTNAASKSALTSSLINSLSTGSSTPVDADYYVSQYKNGGTSNTSFVRRPVSALWEYIKGKISSVLKLTATNYSGKAATAGKATADASGNNIEETYQKKLGASVDASGVVSFPADVCANGTETLATIRYLQAYYSQFPKAGQGITINTDSDGAPIILVKTWKPNGVQLNFKRANPGDLASWRMKNMNFDHMGRISMVSDDYMYMPVPNDFGTAGQLLFSNGDGNAPKWKSGIGLPLTQKGFAYSGSGNSGKYAWICRIYKSSQSGASDTIHVTFKIYTNTTGNGLSATADVWYRRNNGKQGTTKGQLTWTHGISPSNFKLYANVYDDLSNNININLFAHTGATYQRVEASLDHISSLNATSTITNENTSLFTNFYSNSFVASLPTLGTNLELK